MKKKGLDETTDGLDFDVIGSVGLVEGFSERAAAMSLADSEAAFRVHCDKVSPGGQLFELLTNQRITNLSSLAFAVGTPQSPPTEEQFREFATGINGGVDMTFGGLAILRRLHFEASAIVMAELKTKATDSTGDGSRKLPIAEKNARLLEQETRLRGLKIRGELQPSFALVDMVAQMKETNTVLCIPPSKCTKRDAEIQNNLKEKPITLSLEQQMVKLASTDDHITADTSTDLQLQWAMQRRGLAFDQCALISHDVHETWVQQLLGQLTREAPSGFSRVSVSQIIRADRELFTLMAQELQGPLQPDQDGELPMNKKLRELRTDPRVTMFLLPLPRSAPKESEKATVVAPAAKTGAQAPLRPAKKARPSAKAKSMCPQELRGYQQKDPSGNAICWAFNLKSGCKNEVSNGKCKKGVHCCIKCHKNNHSLVTCRAN